jgi:hypothetical protein
VVAVSTVQSTVRFPASPQHRCWRMEAERTLEVLVKLTAALKLTTRLFSHCCRYLPVCIREYGAITVQKTLLESRRALVETGCPALLGSSIA